MAASADEQRNWVVKVVAAGVVFLALPVLLPLLLVITPLLVPAGLVWLAFNKLTTQGKKQGVTSSSSVSQLAQAQPEVCCAIQTTLVQAASDGVCYTSDVSCFSTGTTCSSCKQRRMCRQQDCCNHRNCSCKCCEVSIACFQQQLQHCQHRSQGDKPNLRKV